MRQPYLTQDQRDRREEAEAERYANLFETVHARQIRQYYENGGRGDYKPDGAEVHDEVTRIMDRERQLREEDAAEDRADVAKLFKELT